MAELVEEEREHLEVGGQKLLIAKLDARAVRMTLIKLGLGGSGSLEVIAGRLAEHYGAVGDLAYCDVCGGGSDPDLDACPFCGDADDQAREASEMENGTSMVVAGKPAAKALASGTKKELDKAIERVHTALTEGRASAWKIGLELKEIYDRDLWLVRLDEAAKKPHYKSFEQFVHAEFQMTKAHAFNFIRTSANFSEKQVREVGVGKLSLIVHGDMSKATEEEKRRLVEKAKGKSIRKLAAESKERNKKTGGKKRGRRANITVITVGDKHTVKMYAAPANAEEKKTPRRAKALKDQPWGEIVHENGVKMWFRVRESAAGLEMVVVTKRVEE